MCVYLLSKVQSGCISVLVECSACRISVFLSKISVASWPACDQGDHAGSRNFDAQQSFTDMHTLLPAHLSLAITDGQLPCPGIFSELEYHAPFQRAIDHYKCPG